VIRRCEPLYDGDTREVCGARFDDARRMAVCPHVLLDGGDTVGVPADTDYLVSKGVRVADPDADPEALSPDLVAYLQRSEANNYRDDTRYALVDVLDLAQLLRTAHAQDQYDGALLDRVERADVVTQLPAAMAPVADEELPQLQVRHLDGSTQPLMEWMGKTTAELADFEPSDGHRHDCPWRTSAFALSPNRADCDCARVVRDLAERAEMLVATIYRYAQDHANRGGTASFVHLGRIVEMCEDAWGDEPRVAAGEHEADHMARVVRGDGTTAAYIDADNPPLVIPAMPDMVRTYGLYPASSPSEVVAFLNGHRECQPVAVFPPPAPHTAPLLVLYVQARPS
jgi:hypothetical protein